MNIQINVEDYLSVSEIREICKDSLRSKINTDAERILTNLAYNSSHSFVDSILTDAEKDTLKQKVKDVISKTSSSEVFRKADYWHKEDSIAQKYLNEAIVENKESIKLKVIEILENFDFASELEKDAMYILQDAILSKLAKK